MSRDKQVLEGLQVNLCADYAIESYYHDILAFTIKTMKEVNVLNRLESDSFQKIENNFAEVVSVIFYDSSKVVIDENSLRTVSPSKREYIHDFFPNVFEDFDMAKKFLTNKIREWNAINKLVKDEKRFVYETLISGFITVRDIIRTSKQNYYGDNENIVIAELPNFNSDNSNRGDLLIYLTIQGIWKRLNTHLSNEIAMSKLFENDLMAALSENGYKLYNSAKLYDSDFSIIEINRTLQINPFGNSVKLSEEKPKEIWFDKGETSFESLRMRFDNSFLPALVNYGIINLFYRKLN